MSYIVLWTMYEDRYAKKRGFWLAPAVFAAAPDSRLAVEVINDF